MSPLVFMMCVRACLSASVIVRWPMKVGPSGCSWSSYDFVQLSMFYSFTCLPPGGRGVPHRTVGLPSQLPQPTDNNKSRQDGRRAGDVKR